MSVDYWYRRRWFESPRCQKVFSMMFHDKYCYIYNLQEKCRELHKNLCMSIELSSAFHTVNRHTYAVEDAAKDGCPLKFTALIREFYTDMKASASIDGEETGIFLVELGIKQGCIIAPVLFNTKACRSYHSFRERFLVERAVSTIYRCGGCLFILCRLQSLSRLSLDTLFELRICGQIYDWCPHSGGSTGSYWCNLSFLLRTRIGITKARPAWAVVWG